MWVNALLLFIPVSLVLGYATDVGPIPVFVTALLAIVPLADWIRKATEQLAHLLGSAIGGLLNVTFGNVSELILALFVLMEGHQDVVKGQITGAIIGNGLLGLGIAIVAGSFGRTRQKFSRENAGLLSSLLMLSVIGLLVPALFHYTERGSGASSANTSILDERLSLAVSVVLVLVYVANLIYTLVTHRDVYSGEEEPTAEADAHEGDGRWSMKKAIAVLVGGTVLVAIESELVAGALEGTGEALGLSTFFLGVVLLAVVGNAAEYLSAIYFARRGRMGLVLSITLGSTIQIALLVAPVLVLVSYLLGAPMNLVFANPLELVAVAGVAFTVNAIAHDGETDWFEGVLLLAVYAVLVLAFFFATPPGG